MAHIRVATFGICHYRQHFRWFRRSRCSSSPLIFQRIARAWHSRRRPRASSRIDGAHAFPRSQVGAVIFLRFYPALKNDFSVVETRYELNPRRFEQLEMNDQRNRTLTVSAVKMVGIQHSMLCASFEMMRLRKSTASIQFNALAFCYHYAKTTTSSLTVNTSDGTSLFYLGLFCPFFLPRAAAAPTNGVSTSKYCDFAPSSLSPSPTPPGAGVIAPS